MQTTQTSLIDGSKLIIESLARSGAQAFVAYPITPSNWMYKYGKQRLPLFLAAPDEITTLQWMAGLSATGVMPVTSSAFPGIALMVESINMAYAMELPMVIVITQRLGPSTGSATTGAQGDLSLLKGIISGGYAVPVLSPSDFTDAWTLANEAVRVALKYRTPVFLLTSKEMVMYQRSFDLGQLPPLQSYDYDREIEGEFKPYKPGRNLTPPFVPLGDDEHLTRFTASTHDEDANIRKNDPEALANSKRLQEKLVQHLDDFFHMDLDTTEGARDLILTWGITADAAREAVEQLRQNGLPVDLLTVKTLLPVHPRIYEIIDNYERTFIAEENLNGQFRQILFGEKSPENILGINKIGNMITPPEIVRAVETRKSLQL